jgi:glycosidase
MKTRIFLGLIVLFSLRLGLVKAVPPAQGTNPARIGANGLPWWNDRVFYEIFVRSFADSDGDGNGDLQGLISKLDYLNDGDPATISDLGITGLWLMPVMQSPSYHGYDITDYRQVEADYGTNDDFRELIEAAHQRGMAVIIDMVLNHTSAQHPWFQDALVPGSEHDDWYRWSTEKVNEIGPIGQQAWHRGGDRYYYAVFWDQMPDLNFRNPAVTQAVYDIADFWLDEMGVDGFRLDAVRYFVEDEGQLASSEGNYAWFQSWNEHINAANPDALTVGEAWANSAEVARYVPESVDIAFEFDLAAASVRAAGSGSIERLLPVVEQAQHLYPQGQFAPFLTNHDQNRLMNTLGRNVNKVKVAASILLTGPGVPFLYYGEEIGMIGVKPDECIRQPMQWDSTERTAPFTLGRRCRTNAAEFNVVSQTGDPNSLLSHYRNLIHLRNDHPSLRAGMLALVESESQAVYSFVRHTAEEAVLVVINLTGEAVSDYALTLKQGPFGGPPTVELLFGEGIISPPIYNPDGGFDSYMPLPELAPFSITVVRLG